jgi:hypothetical protein
MRSIYSYLQHSKNVCLYKIGSQPFTPQLSFPNATTATLIHCTREGVHRLLSPSFFPNLRTVHYLSAHPGQVDIYRRFSKPLHWLFPNRMYDFYNAMIEAGHGHVQNRLIRSYIHQFDSNGAQLNLLGYGVHDASTYHKKLLHYLQHLPQSSSYELPLPDENEFDNPHFECGGSQGSVHEYIQQRMESDFFKSVMEDCEKEESRILKYRK